MTLRRIVFRTGVRLCEWLLMLHPLWSRYRSGRDIGDRITHGGTWIVTVAFNNEHVIRNQIALIKNYIDDQDFTYIVADNSPVKIQRERIRRLCEQNSVGYVSLPKNLLGRYFGGSYSHGASLNWIYKKIIRRVKPDIFGFIDHDLFPIKHISIEQKLSKQPIYGPLRERSGGLCWYLWAGLGFFRYDFVRRRRVDFLPIRPFDEYMDTGGGNWRDIYSRMEKSQLTFASERHENFREGGSLLGDMMDIIDECWIHTYNGSHWSDEERDGKDMVLDQMLQDILRNGWQR